MDKLLTADELAAFLRTSKAQIYNRVHQGRDGIDIPQSIQIGRRRLWPKSAIDDWVKSQLYHERQKGRNKNEAVAVKPTINRI